MRPVSDDTRAGAERLAAERANARSAKDFARADDLRARIAELGFDVIDEPGGWRLAERAAFAPVALERIPDVLAEPPDLDASVHLLYEGFREDLERFLDGLRSAAAHEVVVVDNASADGAWLESLAGERVRVVHLDRPAGWAEARNAALRSSRGRVLVVADLSVEPKGDVLSPLVRALEDAPVGVAGPWGLVTDDLREFRESEGPVVHAIEGYLMAVRREVFAETGFDPWFAWYRHADLDLSFRIRAAGRRAVVAPVPAERHTHRGWAAVAEPERSRLSKRNFYRFLDRWKDRADLVAPPPDL
jgi:cysteinyl-tRNA synthetase